MSPAEVLAKVLGAGGRVVSGLERPRLLVPPDLKPLVEAHRDGLRQLVLYQETLRRWWDLTAKGSEADHEEVFSVYQTTMKLIDEIGEPTATRLRYEWAKEWWRQVGLCPYCGEAGPFHDPGPERRRSEGEAP